HRRRRRHAVRPDRRARQLQPRRAGARELPPGTGPGHADRRDPGAAAGDLDGSRVLYSDRLTTRCLQRGARDWCAEAAMGPNEALQRLAGAEDERERAGLLQACLAGAAPAKLLPLLKVESERYLHVDNQVALRLANALIAAAELA